MHLEPERKNKLLVCMTAIISVIGNNIWGLQNQSKLDGGYSDTVPIWNPLDWFWVAWPQLVSIAFIKLGIIHVHSVSFEFIWITLQWFAFICFPSDPFESFSGICTKRLPGWTPPSLRGKTWWNHKEMYWNFVSAWRFSVIRDSQLDAITEAGLLPKWPSTQIDKAHPYDKQHCECKHIISHGVRHAIHRQRIWYVW